MLLPTAELTDIEQVYLPYAYPTTGEVRPLVSLYDTVRPGTPLSEVEGDPIAVVRSSVTGVVSGEKVLSHPLYGDLRCAVIDCLPDGGVPLVPDPHDVTVESVLQDLETAGVIDELDGVPLWVKLRNWQENGCDFLVADAVEVQPYGSAAWAVLRSDAEQVIEGLSLLARCVGAKGYHIAVCLSPYRRRSLAMRVGKQHLFAADSQYPVKRLFHRFLENDGVRLNKNSIVCRVGVAACLALYRAVHFNEPHTHAVLTVSGNAVERPQNVKVPFGTPVQELLQRLGLNSEPTHLIVGDVMTGVTSTTQTVPVLPGMSCVLAMTMPPVKLSSPRACIGCGRCVQACHAQLLPFEIHRRYENMHYEHLDSLNPSACDGCGVCSYVCPCGLDLAATVAEAKQLSHSVMVDLE